MTARFHDELLPVTSATSGGDIGMIDPAFGIAGRQQFVRTAMTIYASGGLAIPFFVCLGVETAVVGGLLVRMALGA
ncbi:MAG: hypothetical protein DMG68_01030 [Acidobacteria bacterium]|nr:MAG: hypothetical protein DMG68_01030 [Acidobacteriota bacterium]